MDDERDEAVSGAPAPEEGRASAPVTDEAPQVPAEPAPVEGPSVIPGADEAPPEEPSPELAAPEELSPELAAPEVHRWEVGDLGIPPAHHPPASPELGPNEWYTTRYRSAESPDGGYRLGLGLAVPDDAPGWVTVTGLVMALVSLPLPWVGSAGFLIGVPGSLPTSYFDAWGLGAPSNWLPGILFAVALVLVLRTPRHLVRHGMVPLAVGLFGLGNVWPYVGYAALGWVQPGVWLMIAGCVLMVIGAAIRLAVARGPGT